MAISWYHLGIKLQSDGPEIFSGYFRVNDTSHLVTNFYNSNDLTTDILVTGSGDHWGADWVFTNRFTAAGTTIRSIPYLDAAKSATEWSFWYQNNTTYLGYYAGAWLEYLPRTYVITITPTTDPTLIISNICFPAGTPVVTNQGKISIEKLQPYVHTIRNKTIVGITQTVTQDKNLVCFEKDAIGPNIPSEKTIISKNHCIFYKGKMIKAKNFVGKFQNVYMVKYTGEVLYNVLMEEHDKMMVNNLICETLHPENGIAQIYRVLQKLSPDEQQKLIKACNKHIVKNNIYSSKADVRI